MALGPPPLQFPDSLWDDLQRTVSGLAQCLCASSLCEVPSLGGSWYAAYFFLVLAGTLFRQACSCAVPFFFTLQVVLFFTLWRLLLHRTPGRHSPLGYVLALPSAAPCLQAVRAIALVGSSSPIHCWQPSRRRAYGHRPRPSLLLWLFTLFSCPCQVWAMPPELPRFVALSNELTQAMPEALPEPPDAPALSNAGDESGRNVAATASGDSNQGVDMFDGAPPAGEAPVDRLAGDSEGVRGLPAPHTVPGLPFAEFSEVVTFDAYVIAPGHQPEKLFFPLQVPCEVRDAELAVKRHLKQLRLAFADVVVAAKPQPWPDASVFLVQPVWTTYAGLSAVVLDMTRMPIGSTGPIVACFLTRPTNRVEILRETGFYSFPTTRIYVGSCAEPIGDQDQVFLEHGYLVTLCRDDQPPEYPRSLRQRLSSSAPWSDTNTWPPVRAPQALAVLHVSGRYTFGRVCPSNEPIDRDIASFVGVERHNVHFLSPGTDCLANLSYRGSHLKGVVALVEYTAAGDIPLTIFLDLRQVAGSSQFAVLKDPRLTYEAILGLLPVQPPTGWHVAVEGGRRRHGYVKVQTGDTLLLGFVPAEDVLSDFEVSSTSPASSEDEGGDDGEEGEEEDPDEDVSGPTSQTSTRSRSRRRQGGRGPSPESPASGDPSFDHTATLHLNCVKPLACEEARPQEEDELLSKLAAACMSTGTALTVNSNLCSGHMPSDYKVPVMQCRVPDFADCALSRNTTEAHRTTGGDGDREPFDRTPLRPPTPVYAVPLPEVPMQPWQEASVHLVVLVPRYKPEVITLTIQLPVAVHEVLGGLNPLRHPDSRRLFPHLVPVMRQPFRHFAVILAGPCWPAEGLEVLFDVRLAEPYLQAGRAPEVSTREGLLQAAGLSQWLTAAVWVAPFAEPLAPHTGVRIEIGALIVVQPRDFDGPSPVSFAAMLASPEGWDNEAALPFRFDPSLWIVHDTSATGLLMPPGGRRLSRNELAAFLGYRLEGLVTAAPEPPIRDFCQQGFVYSAVVAVSQAFPDRPRGPGQPCIVFLDLRPILQDLVWIMLDPDFTSLEQALSAARRICPEGYQVQVTGAPPNLHRRGGPPMSDGFRLAFEYVPVPTAPVGPAAAQAPDTNDRSPSSDSWRTLRSGPSEGGSDSGDEDGFDGPPRGPPPPIPHNGLSATGCTFCPSGLALCIVIHAALAGTAEARAQSIAEDPAARAQDVCVWVAVQYLCWLFQTAPAFLHLAGVVAFKLLCEPCGAGTRAHSLLTTLRTVTRRLGFAWQHLQLDDDPLPIPDEQIDGWVSEGHVGDVIAPVAILKPEYSHELFAVELRLPCTLHDAVEAVQACRRTPDYLRFPHLCAVDPQPVSGFATFLALPRWRPDAIVACINAARVDGRVFAAYVPSYANYDSLCWFIDVPPQVGYDLYIGGDDQPLTPGVFVHLSAGMQICVVEPEELPSPQRALPPLLLHPDFWQFDCTFPESALSDVYCVASRDHHRMHVADFRSPMPLREQIAECVGLPLDRFHLLRSEPTTQDVLLFGVLCRTILGACTCEGGSGDCLGFFLDLRPIQEGIRLACTRNHSLNLETFVQGLTADAPPGWRPVVHWPEPNDQGHLLLHPGAVVVVDYEPIPVPVRGATDFLPRSNDEEDGGFDVSPSNREVSQEAPTGIVLASGQGDPPPVAAVDPPTGSANSQGSQQGAHGGQLGDDTESSLVSGQVEAQSGAGCLPTEGLVFQIFSPEYDSEIISTDLVPPVGASAAFALVSQLREADAHRRSPRPAPSHPQMHDAPVALLAMPHWPYSGVIVLIDCRLVNGRAFALAVPGILSREDVLFLAGLSASEACQVFHRDLPWPLAAGSIIHPEEADLFAVYPHTATPRYQPTFAQLLSGDVACGHPDAGNVSPCVNWILSDGEQRAVALQEDCFATDSAQASEALGLAPGHFLLIPSLPNIANHSRRGTLSTRVLVACQLQDYPGGPEEQVPFVCDLRPILLEIGWAYAPRGSVDMQVLGERLQVRCPAGYHVRIYGGTYSGDVGNHYRQVQAGEVITAEYHPNFVREVVSGFQPASYVPDTDGAGGPRSSTHSNRSPAASSASSHPDAGTGGSRAGPFGRLRQAPHRSQYMCRRATIVQHALAEGRPVSTPVPRAWKDADACAPGFSCRLRFSQALMPPDIDLRGVPSKLLGDVFALLSWITSCIACQVLRQVHLHYGPALLLLVLWHFTAVVEGVQLQEIPQRITPHIAVASGDPPTALNFGPHCCDLPITLRPVPTPVRSALCRGPVIPPSSTPGSVEAHSQELATIPDEDITQGLLHTLLEESRLQSQDYPLYLAATLLDTLVEHFSNTDEASADLDTRADEPQICTLSLCDSLPHTKAVAPPALPAPLNTDVVFGRLSLSSPDQIMHLGGVSLGFTGRQAYLFMQPAVRFGTLSELIALLPSKGATALSDGLPAPVGDPCLTCYVDGSYTPSTSQQPYLLGWSCIFTDPAHASVSIISGAAPPWFHALAVDPSAFVAECVALTAAVWVGSTAFWGRHVTYRSDCQAALQVASGRVASLANGVALTLRRTVACFDALLGRPAELQYVPGHCGVFGNEAADAAAKLASAGSPVGALSWDDADGSNPTCWWDNSGQRIEWCGLAMRSLRGDATLPPLGELTEHPRSHLGFSPEQTIAPFCPQQPRSCNDGLVRTARLDLCLATYNVLSLSGQAYADREPAGLAYAAGRPAMLAACLSKAGVHIAALQEARTEAGFLRTDGYLRFASGGTAGCLGVELWFRDGHALLTEATGGHHISAFCKEAFVTGHKDSRRLLMHFHSGPIKLCFASLHAPHRGTEHAKLAGWWEETLSILRHASAKAPIVVGGDFNASVGSLCCTKIGDVSPEEQDESGSYLKELLDICHCWLPSTWEHCHTGQSWTYVQKRNGLPTRPDFVGLPDCWGHAQVSSWVDPEIHVGQPYIDHLAAVVQVSATLQTSGGKVARSPVKVDMAALTAAESRPTLQAIIDAAPCIPWQASADAHAAALVGYLQSALPAAFPRPARRKRQAYLSDNTWALHTEVAALRRRCARLRAQVQQHLTAAAFRAWAGRNANILHEALSSPWAFQAEVQGHRQSTALRTLANQLKRACRADRAKYLSSLADEVQANSDRSYQALHRLLGLKNKKPFAPEVLPEVLDAEGHVCESPETAMQRWRSYFGDMEAGVPHDLPGVDAEAAERDALAWTAPGDAVEMPGLSDVSQAIAQLKCNKACGPDGLPGDIFKALPASFATLLMPLALKLGILGEEAAGLKGSLLTWLYKHRGARNLCTSYRAIMLLPALTKILHRSLRPRLYEHVMGQAPPILLGGRKGASAVFGGHLTRAFRQWSVDRRQPSCILFADVASAYYNSIRELTACRTDKQGRPASALTSAQRAQVGDEVVDTIAEGSAFRAAGASPWLESIAAELHRGTWFCLKGDSTPVITHRGSRPGSSLADIMYSAGVERIIAKRDSLRGCSTDADCVPRIPWDGHRDLSASAAATQEAVLSDVIWADDLAECFLLTEASRAASQIGHEASCLDGAFASHGYTLSYGTSKTAALAYLGGPGSRAAKRALFGRATTVAVLREEKPAAALPLVTQYKHLGVVVGASFLVELQARCSSAWAAFRQGRVRAYRCRHISVARRGALLRCMVLPRLLFGAGAWPKLRKDEEALYQRTVSSMYRQTLCVPKYENQHISGATMCALLCLPDPKTVLFVERLRYLRQLVQAAPDVLWALIRSDLAFLSEMRSSLAWLFRRLSATIPLANPDHHWQDWADMMCNSPGRFRGWIKRAATLEVHRLTALAALQTCHSFLAGFCKHSDVPSDTGPKARFVEACLPCKKAFVDRVSWACHASKVHGYRTRATELTRGAKQAWCSGCGKLFASVGRMQRHVFVTPTCQQMWGSFLPTGGSSLSPIHPSAPPVQLAGSRVHADGVRLLPDGACHPGLLEALLALDSPEDSDAWEAVVDFVAPLEHLRHTVRTWCSHTQAQDFAPAVSENLLLLLDPDLCCDHFPQPSPAASVVDFFAPLPPVPGLALPFATTGTSVSFSVDPPPLPCFVYPFDCSVPLSAASRQTEWLTAATDILLQAVQMSLQYPVRFRCSAAALQCLEPLTTWLLAGGFVRVADGIASPAG